MAVFTNVPNSVLDPGDPIRSVDIIAIKENTNFLFERNTTNVQTFDASGTWTKPTLNGTGVGTMARIQVWGGGAGASRSIASNENWGGGGAGYNEIIVPLSSLASSVAVTIGAGGAGRTGSSGPGGNGGNSSFGTLISGFGGGGPNVGIGGIGYGGGSLTAGQPNVRGFPWSEQWGGGTGSFGGAGTDQRPSASSVFGGGGGAAGQYAASNGLSVFGGNGGDRNTVGAQPGGGGGGSSSGNGNGSNGGAGRVIVTVW
jgi:hypothetical protein